MKLETAYAHALHTVVTSKPDSAVLANLRAALARRGHIKLLPKIFSEYTKLQLYKERLALYTTQTKESERTRQLLDLYKKLITTP